MNAGVRVALDVADLKQFAPGYKRDRPSAAAHAPGAPDAMHVIFAVVGQS
jgi:hypothetical protein